MNKSFERNPWEIQSDTDMNQVTTPVSPRKNVKVWDIHYRRVLSIWPWMIPSGLLFLFCSWLWLRYQIEIYQVSASMIVSDQEQVLASANIQPNFTRDPINDNIARMRSPNLLKRLVDTMGLNYHVVKRGRFKNTDLYGAVSWKIISSNPIAIAFDVRPLNKGFQWNSDNQSGYANWGEAFSIHNQKIVIEKKSDNLGAFSCFMTDSWNDALNLSGELQIAASKVSNVVQLTTVDTDPQRAADILNTLIQVYNGSILSGKRASQEQGLGFIEERLTLLARQLDSIESVLAKFKSEKGLLINGDYLVKTMNLQEQIDQFRLNNNILNSTEKVINNPKIPDTQKSFIGVGESNLQPYINAIVALQTQRDQLALTLSPNHPKLALIEQQIQLARKNFEAQLENYKRVTNLQLDFIKNKESINKQNFQLTPWEEKRLNEITRFQKIKLDQFLAMLQRKEDYALSLASISVQTFIVRPALVPSAPIGMSNSQFLLIAFFSGIWLPFIIAISAEFLNNKIISRKQLQQMLTPPVIAELDQVKVGSDNMIQVRKKDRSIFGEQIRSLRAGLRYFSPIDNPFYILLTSSMSGEGKSFISINLAASFALQGKKVALLELDLRRPKLSKIFGFSKSSGLSSFLIGKLDVNDIAIRIGEEMELDLFPAGIIPPNPSELLSSDKMTELKKYLDEHYDVVIIDTPPNGIVSDAQLIQSWCHIALIITRFRMTIREQIKDIEEWYQSGIFRPMAIILNGVSVHGYYGSRYGYYYTKRKYGYKYYSDTNDTPEMEKKNLI
ncbi:MAG: GumC family protein [Lacibacter sp.]